MKITRISPLVVAAPLAFVPQDGEPTRIPPLQRLTAGLAWVRDVGLPALGQRIAGRRW